jgi:hypothetical protein
VTYSVYLSGFTRQQPHNRRIPLAEIHGNTGMPTVLDT